MNTYSENSTYRIEASRPVYRLSQFIWYVLWIVNTLLALRFLLRLLGANPAAGFTNFMYSLTEPLASPFFNVFANSRLEGRVVEWASVLAIIVYSLVAWVIIRLLLMARPVSHMEAKRELDRQAREDV